MGRWRFRRNKGSFDFAIQFASELDDFAQDDKG